jgi:homoserine O-succinyltransferase
VKEFSLGSKKPPALQIGLLNMMADRALRATERQFTRLLHTPRFGGPVDDLIVFSLPQLERSAEARRYISTNYLDFGQVRRLDLDALIITGVNLSDPRLEIQPFWDPLQEVMAWAEGQVATTLCSCLATHAVLQFRFGQKRRPLPRKLWGVFEQRVMAPEHSLTTGLPAVLAVPHSRHNDVSLDQFQDSGLRVLIADQDSGVHLACDQDLKLVVMQGHPEYDTVSLLKEYKREVGYYQSGRRSGYPPLPVNCLSPEGEALLEGHRSLVEFGQAEIPFPEDLAVAHLKNTWAGPTEIFFGNWLTVAARLNGKSG